jgi:signal transduction histidine kinase
MERWRWFGLATFLSIVALIVLFLVAEIGRARMRDASEQMHAALSRRVLVGELRREVSEAALGYRGFLLTGRPEYLAPLRPIGRRVNAAAETLVDSYRGESPRIGGAARQLRYLAGVQVGEMNSVLALYRTRGPSVALELLRHQDPRGDINAQFLAVADVVERYEIARLAETRERWLEELARMRWLAVGAAATSLLLVLSASLMAAATLGRHRDAMTQVERHREELEADARVSTAELNEAYAQLQNVQEQERSQLARGLHDELGGLLLAARMDSTWVRQHARDAAPDALRHRLDRIVEVLDQGIDLKRRVIEELRPTLLDNMGLLAALRWQLDETCTRAGLKCTSHFPAADPRVTPRTAIALFRVLQEALTNVLKHAGAHQVEVTLEATPSHVVLVVTDDGRGIEPDTVAKARAHGLAGMRHRIGALGGTLHVGRAPGGGTEVRATVSREADRVGAPMESASRR